MTLFQCSMITGLSLLALGILITKSITKVRSSLFNFPRSKICSYWFVGIATIWFLWRHVAFLSEADFGNYKLLIGTIALSTSILSFFFVADFLAVRGLAMIVLLWSREVLNSAFLQEPNSRLFLVSIIYILIISSIYFGAWPYRMRDFIEWLQGKSNRIISLGWILSFVGVAIIALTFSY